jgi:hypothetical protein
MTAPSAGDWQPSTAATITITDPDLNKNPLSAETQEIGNSSSVIPTIKMGSPLCLNPVRHLDYLGETALKFLTLMCEKKLVSMHFLGNQEETTDLWYRV